MLLCPGDDAEPGGQTPVGQCGHYIQAPPDSGDSAQQGAPTALVLLRADSYTLLVVVSKLHARSHPFVQLRAAAFGLSIGLAIEDALESEIEALGDSFDRDEAAQRKDKLLLALVITIVLGLVHAFGSIASRESSGDDETPLGIEFKPAVVELPAVTALGSDSRGSSYGIGGKVTQLTAEV